MFRSRRIQRSRNNRWFAGVGVLVSSLALTAVGAEAVPINFSLDFSGSVSYAGGANPLVTTNGGVGSVSSGTTSIPVSGGVLNFSTGNFSSGSATSTGFQNIYSGGGSLVINGDIGNGVVTLLSASFLGPVTFDCCLSTTSSLSALLTINSVDSNLASLLGFTLPATGGSLGQTQLFFSGPPTGPGLAFSGLQGGGVIAVADYVPLPPAVFLMGSGLASLVGLRFCRGRRDCSSV